MIGSFADPFSELHDNIFGGFFGIPAHRVVSAAKKCPTCGCTFAEISASGKVGCPECYTVFSDELASTLRAVHGTITLTGKVPSRHRAKQERAEKLKKLRLAMQDAIQKEDFEKAASLRDEIKTLENDNTKKDGEA